MIEEILHRVVSESWNGTPDYWAAREQIKDQFLEVIENAEIPVSFKELLKQEVAKLL